VTATVRTYFIDGDDVLRVPASYAIAKSIAREQEIAIDVLRSSAKWEPLIEGIETTLPCGWTTLGALARTKRGIATGHNEFFLLSRQRVAELGIQDQHHQRCIGRASDVRHYCFTAANLDQVEAQGGRTRLLTFRGDLNPAELAYVQSGEQMDVNKRYLLRQRSPWYTMERRPPAPIWALVFTRAGARFIRNDAGALSLTNFHAIYPINGNTEFHDALACVLNSAPVAQAAQGHWRRYGGGLTKFEPADLLPMPVPDLNRMEPELITELARLFRRMDERSRSGDSLTDLHDTLTALIDSGVPA
jgi:adenine-specific DNA-methyltransferase